MSDGPDGHEADKDKPRTSPTSIKSVPTHKRTLSGNLFSRLNFLRSTSSDDRMNQSASSAIDKDHLTNGPDTPTSAMAAVQGSLKGRQRKTSLRKTALLGGTVRYKSLPLQRKGSNKQQTSSKQDQETRTARDHDEQEGQCGVHSADPHQDNDTTHLKHPDINQDQNQEQPLLRQSFSYEDLDAASSASAWSTRSTTEPSHATRQLAVHSEPSRPGDHSAVQVPSTSPSITSPASQSYASTTDDDDVLSFSRRPATGPVQPASYYVSVAPLTRRRSSKQTVVTDPLPLEQAGALIEEELDYSDTEWWGWVVLIITWFAFVVGMGSCFGVWSWAWDVGQTPYAPPELEDDPTLPIVGYYPALITLTAVMAWVWVVVAWVGIKYFKHAKIQGEDN